MPPKKKKKKSKKAKDPEQEVIELKRKELIRHAQHLTKEIVDEEKTKEEFSARLEQTKMMWDIEKNKLEVSMSFFHDVIKLLSMHRNPKRKI